MNKHPAIRTIPQRICRPIGTLHEAVFWIPSLQERHEHVERIRETIGPT